MQGEDDIDPELILSLLYLSQFRVSKGLNKQRKTATQLWKHIPYMQLLPKHQCCDGTVVEAHGERLRKNLIAWNFSQVAVQPDGNCFFISVALALVQNTDKSRSILDNIHIDTNGSVLQLSSKLREVIVQEWL